MVNASIAMENVNTLLLSCSTVAAVDAVVWTVVPVAREHKHALCEALGSKLSWGDSRSSSTAWQKPYLCVHGQALLLLGWTIFPLVIQPHEKFYTSGWNNLDISDPLCENTSHINGLHLLHPRASKSQGLVFHAPLTFKQKSTGMRSNDNPPGLWWNMMFSRSWSPHVILSLYFCRSGISKSSQLRRTGVMSFCSYHTVTDSSSTKLFQKTVLTS